MDKRIIELWADIGSEEYWGDLVKRHKSTFVSFDDRWPQPGFIGRNYVNSQHPVLVMGQNPRASNTSRANDSDMEMFHLIQKHSKERSTGSLEALFSMMRLFMRGQSGYKPTWPPIRAAERHLDLELDNIAYLNLIPLATTGDRIVPAFREAFERSTERQLGRLQPAKIVVYGKRAYEKFVELGGGKWQVRYIEQRDFKDAPSVRSWLNSN